MHTETQQIVAALESLRGVRDGNSLATEIEGEIARLELGRELQTMLTMLHTANVARLPAPSHLTKVARAIGDIGMATWFEDQGLVEVELPDGAELLVRVERHLGRRPG